MNLFNYYKTIVYIILMLFKKNGNKILFFHYLNKKTEKTEIKLCPDRIVSKIINYVASLNLTTVFL